ncbi:MAG: ATP-binding protein [Candidatus Electryonea clarkiae]|nr:ATP-binding protein [Candidatus Electryonea clarkiae]MDP8286562.1 ATP-binding protein [Candidatus Electryonea clarkiae]
MIKRNQIFWKLSAAFICTILLVLAAEILLGKINSLSSGRYLQISLIITIAVLLGSASAWFFVKYFIQHPTSKLSNEMNKLADGMNKLADKEFDFRLDENEKDDFGMLASSFNDMAEMLSLSQSELEKTRDYLQGILESSGDIIITVFPSGKIRTFNKGAENALGYRRVDIIGEPIEILFADPHERDAAIEKLTQTDNVVNFETRFLTKSGEIRDVLLSISQIRNSTGAIIGTIGISKDITRVSRLQVQLVQSQRLAAIGEVFTGVQHSLKNMLNACKGGAYMVRIGLKKDDRSMFEEGWEIVSEGISSMTNMSTDMLKYVREWKPNFERVELDNTLAEIDRVIKQTAKDKGVNFQLNVPPELPSVICDARMIHTAVMDIVSNAMDACLWKEYTDGELPELILGAYPDDDGQNLVIEVKDNGCGMTEEVKKNIFAPFFSTKSKSGTGLGLAITSRMIGIHNGKFDVDSEPDKGTIFRIVLPIDGTDKH